MHRKLGAHYFKLIISLKFWVTKIWNIASKTGFVPCPYWLTIYTLERKVWVQVHYHCKPMYIEATISLGRTTWWDLGSFGNRSKILNVTFWEKIVPVVSLHKMPCNHLKSNLMKMLNRFSILNSWHIAASKQHWSCHCHMSQMFIYNWITLWWSH